MVYDQLYMEYKLPEGINSTRVARDLEEIEAYLKKRPEMNLCHVVDQCIGRSKVDYQFTVR